MLDTLEAGIGLDVVLWLQENRTAWMEVLSILFAELGDAIGYIAIFGLIYWTINRKEGLRLIFALALIGFVTFALKDILMRPRPFIAFPDLVTPVFEAEGYGLPSGHTSFAVMIWGYIALWIRKTWMTIFALIYMTLQGIMRMVAGVHFPQDIVLGVIVGVITLASYMRFLPYWEKFWIMQPFMNRLMLAIGLPIALAVIIIIAPLSSEQTETYLTMFGLALGAGVGLVIEARWSQFMPTQIDTHRAIIFALGVVLTLAVLFGLSPLFDAIAETGVIAYSLRIIRYGLAGFVAIAVVPYLGVQLKLMPSKKNQPVTTS